MQNFLMVLCVALTMIATPLLALVAAPASGAGPFLVISSPGNTARQALIERAGGWPVGPDHSIFAGFATSESPNFHERLRAAGAWFVLDGKKLAAICGVEL